ncbi:unnamed protein product [Ilex paraguariensis]|uniref:Uncharacterized protein n=1 Tax=Ilex paraguariensis TaxID=185542 RepID=A0ABC8SND6_9AQUA
MVALTSHGVVSSEELSLIVSKLSLTTVASLNSEEEAKRQACLIAAASTEKLDPAETLLAMSSTISSRESWRITPIAAAPCLKAPSQRRVGARLWPGGCQGGSSALEDSVILARCLAETFSTKLRGEIKEEEHERF